MNPVSDEQQAIIDVIQKGYNVVVDACAGSGKSTTILSTAKSYPERKFLLITYNKSLKKSLKKPEISRFSKKEQPCLLYFIVILEYF